MRLELTSPLDLNLSADGDARRVVGGLAVPWNVTARLANGRRARFLPGSIDATPERAPLLCRSHDRARPFGVVYEATTSDAGIYARARISRTVEGDEALTLAADGVLRGLSVGVEALTFHEEDDGGGADDPVIVVEAARWDELSLCPWAAFDQAAVDYVAASAPDPSPDETPADPPTDEPEEPDQPEEPVPDTLDAIHPTAVLQAAPPLAPSRGRAPTLYGVARDVVAAVQANAGAPTLEILNAVFNRANADAATRLDAAWTDVVTPSGTSGVAGLVRDSWENEVVGLIQLGAQVVGAFLQGNLTSNPVAYPKWTTLPTLEVQATQKTLIGSGPVRIDRATADVATIAGGNDVSMQAIDWSTPDFITEYFRACAEVYARIIDDTMTDLIVAAATDLEESGDGIGVDLGAAIGLVAATGLPPDRIIAGSARFGQLWGANVGITSGGISQVLNVDLPQPRVILAPQADPDLLVVTSSRVAKSWQNRGAPVQLRAVNVSLLGMDLGVYGYFAADILHGPDTDNPAIQSIVPDAGP